jgi:hypothetical protein
MTSSLIPKDVKILSRVLDRQFMGPLNTRFGVDSIIGLIPVWGDLIGLVLSHYVLVRSILIKCPAPIIIKMMINTYLDFIIGCVPILGDIFDLYWKSNTKNTELLEKYLASPKRTNKQSLIFIILLLLIIFLFFFLCIYFLMRVFNFISS